MVRSNLKDRTCVAPDDIISEKLFQSKAQAPEPKNAKNTLQK